MDLEWCLGVLRTALLFPYKSDSPLHRCFLLIRKLLDCFSWSLCIPFSVVNCLNCSTGCFMDCIFCWKVLPKIELVSSNYMLETELIFYSHISLAFFAKCYNCYLRCHSHLSVFELASLNTLVNVPVDICIRNVQRGWWYASIKCLKLG